MLALDQSRIFLPDMTGINLRAVDYLSPFSGSPPFVSVIIPVYNDPDGIKQTLDSLLQQTYPSDAHEIIVVDNDSTDNTRSIVTEFERRWDHILLEVEDDIQGSYAARNRGIRASRGKICAFIDSDMVVGPNWLTSAVRRMENRQIEYLACHVRLFSDSVKESALEKYNRLSEFKIGEKIKNKNYGGAGNLFVRRSLLDDVGMFDDRLISGGDVEFGNRVYESGRALHYADDIVQYHPTRSSFKSLFKKSIRQGRGVGQLQRYYPKRYGRPGIPPRPDGSTVTERDQQNLTRWEQLIFYLFTILFTALRGVGYYLELLGSPERTADEGKSAVTCNATSDKRR